MIRKLSKNNNLRVIIFFRASGCGSFTEYEDYMLVTCEKCSTKYEIPDDALLGKGRKVKCDNCGHVWFQSSIKKMIYDELYSAVEHFDDPIPPKEVVAQPDMPLSVFGRIAEKGKALSDIFNYYSQSVASAYKSFTFSGMFNAIGNFFIALENGFARLCAKMIVLILFLIISLSSLSGLFVGKDYVLKAFPEMYLLYKTLKIEANVPGEGIKINNLAVRQEKDGDKYGIAVSGELINSRLIDVELPAMKIYLRDSEGKIVDTLTTGRSGQLLEPTRGYPFERKFWNVSMEGVVAEIVFN